MVDPYFGLSMTHLIVNSIVSYPSPLQKERGGEWIRSLLLVEYIDICLLISKTTNKKGSGRGGSWPYVFE